MEKQFGINKRFRRKIIKSLKKLKKSKKNKKDFLRVNTRLLSEPSPKLRRSYPPYTHRGKTMSFHIVEPFQANLSEVKMRKLDFVETEISFPK